MRPTQYGENEGNVIRAFAPAGGDAEASVTGRKPYFLHGWGFLDFSASEDEGAVPIRSSAPSDGPLITFNPFFMSSCDLENPATARMWLSPCLTHICYVFLNECASAADGVGRFTSEAWSRFRDEACRHAAMGWEEILEGVSREGLDFMADYLAFSFFFESGLHDTLEDRRPVSAPSAAVSAAGA